MHLQVGKRRAQHMLERMPHASWPVVGAGRGGVVDEVLVHQLVKAGLVAVGDYLLVEALDDALVEVEKWFHRL
jgi:hypothetical protein